MLLQIHSRQLSFLVKVSVAELVLICREKGPDPQRMMPWQGMRLPACETASQQPSLPGMQLLCGACPNMTLTGSTQHGKEVTLPQKGLPMCILNGRCSGARLSANVTTAGTQQQSRWLPWDACPGSH